MGMDWEARSCWSATKRSRRAFLEEGESSVVEAGRLVFLPSSIVVVVDSVSCLLLLLAG